MRFWLLVAFVACRHSSPAISDAEPAGSDDAVALDGAIDGAIDAHPDARMIDAAIDAPPDAPIDAVDPNDLLATGLCLDAACTQISPYVHAFEPRWHLWSDGATKRRWIQLPPGTKINTSNLDYWQFPIGTKLWKEFTMNGVRVETRFLERTGAGWTYMGYEWNAAQTHAVACPNGDVDVLGTTHDIPSQQTCKGCHANNVTPVLGFSYFQLDYTATAGNLDLAHASALGWFTQSPPHATLPGTQTDQDMLGYVHVNCGHCHNSDSQQVDHPMLRIESAHIATMTDTRLYTSTVNVTAQVPFEGATIIVAPHDPDNSVIIKRTTTTDIPHRMPALGIKTVDPAEQPIMRAWINSL